MAFERATYTAPQPKKRVNAFYELCDQFARVYNLASDRKVTAKRFMRDCKTNKRAYELALIDYQELLQPSMSEKERARLLFGKLKVRKATL